MGKIDHYRERAESFIEAMKLLFGGHEYRHAVALLAVHSAIAFADAVTLALTGNRGRYQDHREAVRQFRRICRRPDVKVEPEGLGHFEWLVSNKNKFSYDDQPIVPDEVRMSYVRAERFQAWVYRNFKQVVARSQE